MSTAQLQRGAPQKKGAALDISKLSRGDLERLVQTSIELLRGMAERLSTPLVLLDDQVTSQTRFVEIAGALVKASVTCQSPLIVYDPANNELIHSPATTTLDVSPCREGDLLDLQRVVKSGQDQVQVRDWLKKLRAAEEAPKPVEIKIVNANEINATPKVLTVKRDDSGKMTGAVSQPIS